MELRGGAQVTALTDVGYSEVFDFAVGMSTGAPTVAYFLSGQARVGTSIYYEDLPANKFIHMRRMLTGGDAADIDMLCSIFRGELGNKKLDEQKVLDARTRAFISAIQYKTGKLKLFDAYLHGSIIDLIQASIAMPIFYRRKVYINGKRYIDGSIGYGLPSLEFIRKRFNPTDILILANRDSEHLIRETPIWFKIAEHAAYSTLPQNIRNLLRQDKLFKLNRLNAIRGSGIRYAIVWNKYLNYYEMNSAVLKEHADVAYKHFMSVLKRYR